MIINIALWTDPSLFGVFGNDLRNTWSNPFINTFVKVGGTGPGRACLRGRSSRPWSARSSSSAPCTTSSPNAASSTRSRSRLTPRPARRRSGRCPRRPSAASCTTRSSRALGRLPELAGRDLTLVALSGGITNRNFLVSAAGTPERWVIRLAGNDTHLLGICREVEHAATVAAAGVGVGPEVTAFIRPEGYLVTRFIEGSPVSDEAVHQPETLRRVADSLRRIHDGPAIPGLFVPLRIVEAYRALALARGVRIPADYDLAAAIGRRIELACLRGADRAAAVPQRPAQRELHRRRHADPDRRLGVRRHGRPVLRPRQLQHQPRADAGRGRRAARGVRRRDPAGAVSPG